MPHLSEQQHVAVCPPDLPRLAPFDAVVVALDGRIVSLQAIASEPLQSLPPELRNVRLIHWSATRPFALKGTLRYEPATEYLRFRIDDRGVRISWRPSRVALTAPVTLQPMEDGLPVGAPQLAITSEVATDHLRLEPGEITLASAHVSVQLTLPGEDDAVRASGRVQAGPPHGAVTITLVDIPADDRARLRAFIFQRRRERLKLNEQLDELEDF